MQIYRNRLLFQLLTANGFWRTACCVDGFAWEVSSKMENYKVWTLLAPTMLWRKSLQNVLFFESKLRIIKTLVGCEATWKLQKCCKNTCFSCTHLPNLSQHRQTRNQSKCWKNLAPTSKKNTSMLVKLT